MSSESEIHALLARFGPAVVAFLTSINFWEIEGPYDAQEVLSSIPASDKRAYLKESKEKNSAVWNIAKSLFVFDGLLSGARRCAKTYNLPAPNATTLGSKPYVEAYYKERGLEFIKSLTATDTAKLKAFVWANASQNERPFAKMVLKEPNLRYITDMNEVRAKLIKRTETVIASNGGEFRFARDNGAKFKEWHAVNDRRTRPSHRALNGQIRAIDEPFPHGRMLPDEPNCRCHLSYSFK